MPGERKSKPESPLKQTLVSIVAGFMNWLLTAVCRQRLLTPTYAERRRNGQPGRCIYAAWHCQLWHGCVPLQGQGNSVMVSNHRDGEIIAKMLARRGFELVRGSSTRGGSKALRDFARAAREGEADLVVTIDGPKGPSRVAKPGVLFTASLTGLPIVPMGLWVDRAWHLNSWDRLVIGKPLSRVVVAFGDELHVPRGTPREELETVYRERLEKAMAEAEERARQAVMAPAP